VRLVKSDEPRTLRLMSNSPCLEWLSWALQLTLLQAQACFVHGAGVEVDGQGVLLPSWGGVGKTAIAKHFVVNLGWRLLGDDLVILTDRGQCLGFPKPMVLYPYHRRQFPAVFASGHGPAAPMVMNSALSRLAAFAKPLLRLSPALLQWARRHNPQSVRVNPSAVFGRDRLACEAHLSAVVWLDRMAGLSAPQLRPVDRRDVASRIFGSTLREQDAWCINATLVACGLGILRADDIYRVWLDVLDRGLQSATTWVLLIPQDTSIDDVGCVVDGALRNAVPELF